MLEKWFRLAENGTTARREILAGVTTFLTMAYIIFVQPAMLSGEMFNKPTGMDFGAILVATCLASAFATVVMALYARYPIALAPGMGMNAFFAVNAIPAAAALYGAENAWQVALGAVFVAGVLFLLITLTGVREWLFDAVSPSLKNGIAVGIGMFIAFIGLQNAGLIVAADGTLVKLTPHFASPDVILFFLGLLFTVVLYVRGVRGAILWGIAATTLLAVIFKLALPQFPDAVSSADLVVKSKLMEKFQFHGMFSLPPSLAPTFFQMDVLSALSWQMLPFVVIFLIMIIFDTMGTLIGVGEQAGFMRDNKLPRVDRAMLADASGVVVGAALGTSTVTAYIESAAGVEQGGRTGLTALTVAALFLAALFFSPIVQMVGNYLPLTAPALVVVGCMMMRNVTKIDWSDYSEGVPAFLTLFGIPLSYSIADGVALGLISYPILKLAGGRRKEVHAMMYVLAAVLLAYFLAVRR